LPTGTCGDWSNLLSPSFTHLTYDRHMWKLTNSAFTDCRNYLEQTATSVPKIIRRLINRNPLDNSGEKSDLDREDEPADIVKHPSEWTV